MVAAFSGPPQPQDGASSSESYTAATSWSRPQATQATRRLVPCSSITRVLPASWCSPSMFCVTTPRSRPRASSSRQRAMGRVRAGAAEVGVHLAAGAPVAPPRLLARQEVRVHHGRVARPDPARAAEVGDAGRGADARPREGDRAPAGGQQAPRGVEAPGHRGGQRPAVSGGTTCGDVARHHERERLRAVRHVEGVARVTVYVPGAGAVRSTCSSVLRRSARRRSSTGRPAKTLPR